MGSKLLPHLGFIFVYILWGINLSSMAIGGREWDPFVFNGLRYLLLVPLVWIPAILYIRSNPDRPRFTRKDLLLLCMLGVLSAVGMEAFLSYALQYSNPANGAVLGRGIMPVITAVIALITKQLRMTWRLMIGLPFALLGVVIIMTSNGLHFGPETLKGDALLLFRSFIGVAYLLLMNRLVLKYPLTILLAVEITAGAVALLPFVVLNVNGEMLATMSFDGWASLLYTSILATWVGFFVHNWCLGRLGPFKASMYGYLNPITAAIAGAVMLGAAISLNQYAGGVLILLAMYLVQRDRMQMLR